VEREDNATVTTPRNHRLPFKYLRFAIESVLGVNNGRPTAREVARFNQEVADRCVRVKSHIGNPIRVGGPCHGSEAIFCIGIYDLLRLSAVGPTCPDLASKCVAAVESEPAIAPFADGVSYKCDARAVW